MKTLSGQDPPGTRRRRLSDGPSWEKQSLSQGTERKSVSTKEEETSMGPLDPMNDNAGRVK